MAYSRFVTAGDGRYPVRVTAEPRRGVRASIGRTTVHIRVPSGLSAAEREEAISRMLRWAERTIQRKGLAPRPRWRSFVDGETLAVDGSRYSLRLEESGRRTGLARIQGGELRVLLPRGLSAEERGRAVTLLASRALAREWLPDVRAMVEEANSRCFGKPMPPVKLKYLRAIWGSCSRRGGISLSTRLLFAPRVVREYVCVHELAHLVERGHTPAFWRTVESAMPQWREQALWLRTNGGTLWF